MQTKLKYWCLLAFLTQIWHINAYSAIPYTSNRMSSLGYKAEKSFSRPHMHSHHYQRSPIKQQQTHLSLPFYNFNANLRKKPTTKLAHYNNNNNNNMLIYNKRYKRFPPYQAMPEIPIKKPIARYLPYTPLYHMGVITPSLLIPFYMAAGKTPARLMVKPSMYDIPTTANVKPTTPTTYSSNNLPATNLLYNYLRLIGVNSIKTGHQQTILKTTSTTTTIPVTTAATTSTTKITLKPTTSNRAVNMLGNFHVESKIKLLDSPFSSTNLRQQQQHPHHQTYAISKYNHNDNNNNMATHFHFPIMPATTTISSYFPSATTTATTFLALPYRMQQFKQMPMDIVLQQDNNDKEFDFEPTWYPYAKPQKSKNFFTIADAITPYKPIEPITIAYQPYYYDTQTEHYANVKPTTMGFRPVHDIYGTYTQARTTQDYVRTVHTTAMPLHDNLIEMNKWRAVKQDNEAEEKVFDNLNTTAAAALQQQHEISYTTNASIIAKNSTNQPEEHETKAKINRMRKMEKSQTKKPKSFFDDWFADDDFVETTAPTTYTETITTTPSTTTSTSTLKTISTKLKWANKRRTKSNVLKTDAIITTTPSAVATTTAAAAATGVVKKPRKKYANIKNKQNRHKLTTTTTNKHVNNEEIKLNNTKKLSKRIKKVLRVRPTLLPMFKFKQKSTKAETIKEFNTELPATDAETITTAINKNLHEITMMPTTTSTTTPATTTTTTTTTSRTTSAVQERTSRDQAPQRKRGRQTYTYNNQNQKPAATEETKRNHYKTIESRSSTEKSQEARYQAKQRHSRTRTSTTTTTTTSTTANAPTHRSLATSKNYHMRHKQALSTVETAIMKIAQNNLNATRNKRIKNMLENLMIPATTQLTLQSNTEIPPLPIELYFQKMKSGYE